MNGARVADQIEQFVRKRFRVAAGDRRFSRSEPLFESGYVDSVGFIELLSFLSERFGVEVPDEKLLSEDFSTIDDIAAVVASLRNGSTDGYDASAG